jgi:hypothetical protein
MARPAGRPRACHFRRPTPAAAGGRPGGLLGGRDESPCLARSGHRTRRETTLPWANFADFTKLWGCRAGYFHRCLTERITISQARLPACQHPPGE